MPCDCAQAAMSDGNLKQAAISSSSVPVALATGELTRRSQAAADSQDPLQRLFGPR